MKSINKALDILEVFISAKHELTLSEISELTSYNPSTVHGIVSTLTERGYLIQDGRRGKYSLGYKPFQLVETVKIENRVWNVAYTHLRELANLAKEVVTLAVLNKKDNKIIIFQSIYGSRSVTTMGRPIVCLPLYNTGSGKVFLSHFDDEDLEKYIANTSFEPATSHTITDPGQLKKQLSEIKINGYSIDNQESELGTREIAVPIKDSKGNVAATVGIVGPSMSITDDRIQDLVLVLKKSAEQISRGLS